MEVNAHSLFSKWFSESGKLVSKLFTSITELVEEEDTLVFVLIDEVESLTSARKVRVTAIFGLGKCFVKRDHYTASGPCRTQA